MDRDWLRAGWVGSPHGLDGSFHVREPLSQLLDVGRTVAVGGAERTIARRAGTEQNVILRLEGSDDRDAARSLQGEELLAPRAQAPELEPDEWWAEDLEGCAVRDGDIEVGVVRRMLALPSCEVLEVTRSGQQQDLLVPLIRDAVRSVDLGRREIEVNLSFLGER